MPETPELTDALDALEGMVYQYLASDDSRTYDHACMSAGEEATQVLTRLRPERWAEAPRGLRLLDAVHPWVADLELPAIGDRPIGTVVSLKDTPGGIEMIWQPHPGMRFLIGQGVTYPYDHPLD
jgi:hypothetical protein